MGCLCFADQLFHFIIGMAFSEFSTETLPVHVFLTPLKHYGSIHLRSSGASLPWWDTVHKKSSLKKKKRKEKRLFLCPINYSGFNRQFLLLVWKRNAGPHCPWPQHSLFHSNWESLSGNALAFSFSFFSKSRGYLLSQMGLIQCGAPVHPHQQCLDHLFFLNNSIRFDAQLRNCWGLGFFLLSSSCGLPRYFSVP